MPVFVAIFAVAGSVAILISQAATTSQTFSGKLTSKQPTQSYEISTGSGQLNATLSLKGKGNITLALIDKNGIVVTSKTGASSVSITATTATDKYRLAVSTPDQITNKGVSYTVKAAYETVSTADTTAPSIPSNLTAKALSSTEVELNWGASTDNVGVTGY
jgi:hypothetical protein